MKKFKSIDKWYLKNRGWVYGVKNDIYRDECNGLKSFPDLYPEVEIDGTIYETLGVKSYAITIVSEDQPIGILVKSL